MPISASKNGYEFEYNNIRKGNHFDNDTKIKKLQDYLAAGGSDHGRCYYSIKIDEKANKGVEPIKIMSWNMLNKCYKCDDSKTDTYSNNPWNISETGPQYLIRVEEQIEKIKEDIKKGNVDIVMLQEIDWFYDDKNNKLKEIKTHFNRYLEKSGWKLECSIPKPPRKDKKLLTLYNNNKLELDNSNSDKPKFVLEAQKEITIKSGAKKTFPLSTGFETRFKIKENDIKLVACNFHGEYSYDYLKGLSKSNVEGDKINNYLAPEPGVIKFVIGDTNSHQNGDMNGLIVDYEFAGSYDFNKEKNAYYLDDPETKGQKLAHDGILASAPKEFDITVTEEGREVFVEEGGTIVQKWQKTLKKDGAISKELKSKRGELSSTSGIEHKINKGTQWQRKPVSVEKKLTDKEEILPNKDDNLEKITTHIKKRFAALKEILKNTDTNILIAADVNDKDFRELDTISGQPFGHSLGTGLAKGQWSNDKSHQSMLKTIDEEVKSLFQSFPTRVFCGLIGPSNEDKPLGKNYIHVWGANADNWNLDQGGIISGDGQADHMGRVPGGQKFGMFGIVTTPTSGVENLMAEDKTYKDLLKDKTYKNSPENEIKVPLSQQYSPVALSPAALSQQYSPVTSSKQAEQKGYFRSDESNNLLLMNKEIKPFVDTSDHRKKVSAPLREIARKAAGGRDINKFGDDSPLVKLSKIEDNLKYDDNKKTLITKEEYEELKKDVLVVFDDEPDNDGKFILGGSKEEAKEYALEVLKIKSDEINKDTAIAERKKALNPGDSKEKFENKYKNKANLVTFIVPTKIAYKSDTEGNAIAFDKPIDAKILNFTYPQFNKKNNKEEQKEFNNDPLNLFKTKKGSGESVLRDLTKNNLKKMLRINILATCQEYSDQGRKLPFILNVPGAFIRDLNDSQTKEVKDAIANIFNEVVNDLKDVIKANISEFIVIGGESKGKGGGFWSKEQAAKLKENAKKIGIESHIVKSDIISIVEEFKGINPNAKLVIPMMGEPTHAVGNGALSDRGDSALDEDLFRRCLGLHALLANTKYNEHLLEKCKGSSEILGGLEEKIPKKPDEIKKLASNPEEKLEEELKKINDALKAYQISDEKFRIPERSGLTGIVSNLDKITHKDDIITIPIIDIIEGSNAKNEGLKPGNVIKVTLTHNQKYDDDLLKDVLTHIRTYGINNKDGVGFKIQAFDKENGQALDKKPKASLFQREEEKTPSPDPTSPFSANTIIGRGQGNGR